MNLESALVGWLLAALLLGGLLAASEFGYRRGLKRHSKTDDATHIGAIQGAILGLLGLLLGFSFSASSERFGARHQLIVDEANSIGTLWLRTDLLPAEKAVQARGILRTYVGERIAFYEASSEETAQVLVAKSEALQARLWALLVEASKNRPEFAKLLLEPANEMIDLHASRVAALGRHLPVLVMLLLVSCSFVAVTVVSYGCGMAGKRNAMLNAALAFLVASVLWAILDMDHPRRGLIQTGQQPMLDLRASLEKTP